MLTKEQAGNFAKELKIDLFFVYREYLQLLFLKYFYGLKKVPKFTLRAAQQLDFYTNLLDYQKI